MNGSIRAASRERVACVWSGGAAARARLPERPAASLEMYLGALCPMEEFVVYGCAERRAPSSLSAELSPPISAPPHPCNIS